MDRLVTLTYVPGDFVADPFQIPVAPGDTISFQLAPGSLTGTIQITFREPYFFATGKPDFGVNGVFRDGDGPIRVDHPLTGPTSYDCELLGKDGRPIAQYKGSQGGECIPATG